MILRVGFWRGFVYVSALLFVRGLTQAQSDPTEPAQVSFHFERAGVDVPEYTFLLREDGSGSYTASAVDAEDQPGSRRYAQQTASRPLTHIAVTYTLPADLTARLFKQVRDSGLPADCASKQKNLANMGNKTLAYTGPDGKRECTFNYTQNAAIEAATETFEAMSSTLAAGRALKHEQRFDRLGLDQEMNTLVSAVKEGRAQGLSLIVPELRALIDDDQVMQRVRRNANILLDKASVAQ